MHRRTVLIGASAALVAGGLAPSLLAGGASPADRFTFAVIADPQLGMVALERDARNFAAVADAINALPAATRPRFVVVAGDLVNSAGDGEQLRWFDAVKARFTTPVWLVPGNHDVTRDGRTLEPFLLSGFRRQVGPDRFAFSEGGCAFIGLDSQLWTSDATAEEQRRWLESQLRAAGRRPIFVFQHHPLYVESMDEPDAYFNTPRAWRARVLALVDRSRVRAVFTGHLHRNLSTRWRGVSFLTTPSPCRNFDGSAYGYRLVTVERDGAFAESYRGVPGTLPETQEPAEPPRRE